VNQMSSLPLSPTDCPKFQSCSAPVCPLDPLWRSAVHFQGEKVCPYLLASHKVGAAERYAGDAVFQVCSDRCDEVTARHAAIRRAVAKAAQSGFKADNLGVNAVGAGAYGSETVQMASGTV
jgi:hypothetical protein